MGLTRCVVHVHTAASMSMAGSSWSGESIENEATPTPRSPTVWHTAVAAEPAGSDEPNDFSEQFLALVRQSVTGALDVTCRPDGWRVRVCRPISHSGRVRVRMNSEAESCGPASAQSNTTEFSLDRVPDTARTMIGQARLENVRQCIRTVCAENVPGDFAELGAWSGGCGIYAKACIDVYDSQVSFGPRLARETE